MDRLFGLKKKKPESKESSESSNGTPILLGTGPGLLPPQLASNKTYLEAIDHINRAINTEAVCDFTKAMDEYDLGLQLLFALLKSTPKDAENERPRQVLRNVIDKYMTRAEEVKRKKQIREGLIPASSPSPPISTTTASRPVSNIKSPTNTSASSSSSSSTTVSPPSKSAVVYPLDPGLRAAIESEILSAPSNVRFSDIIGMEAVKEAFRDLVILPALRPDIFVGARAPPRGLLVYGPPGNGKSYIAKAVATESHCTFFSLSAASLMSKHLGEGEKLVRALFQVARERAPSIIFIDEIDSILSRRSSEEHEASRRLKTEFMIQFDGLTAASSSPNDPSSRVILMAATNCPEDLDEAIVRRLARRIYIPTPTQSARLALLTSLLSQPGIKHTLSASQLEELAQRTDGYSNSDLTALVSDAAFGPIRSISPEKLLTLPSNQLPPITLAHFNQALTKIRPSVSPERLKEYEMWAKKQEGTR